MPAFLCSCNFLNSLYKINYITRLESKETLFLNKEYYCNTKEWSTDVSLGKTNKWLTVIHWHFHIHIFYNYFTNATVYHTYIKVDYGPDLTLSHERDLPAAMKLLTNVLVCSIFYIQVFQITYKALSHKTRLILWLFVAPVHLSCTYCYSTWKRCGDCARFQTCRNIKRFYL